MADKSMKAVIAVDVDPKGAVKGVAAVQKELAKITKYSKQTSMATSLTAGFTAASTGISAVMSMLQAIDRRMDQINEMSTRFSPEAAREAANTKIAKINQEIALGGAIGGETAAVERAKQRAIAEETQRLMQQEPGARAGMASFMEDLKNYGNAALELPGQLMTNPLGTLMGGAIPPDIKAFYGGASGAELTGGQGSARGMPYDTGAVVNVKIRGGDA